MEKLFLFFFLKGLLCYSPYPWASISFIENKGTAVSEYRTAVQHTRISKLNCSIIVCIFYQCSAHHRKEEKNQYTPTVTKYCIIRIKSFSYLNYLSTCSFRQDIRLCILFIFHRKTPNTMSQRIFLSKK